VLVPSASDGAEGLNETETRAAGKTVKVVVALTEPELAVIVAVPTPTVVAVPVLSIVTIVESEELHATDDSTADVLLLKSPVAVNGWEMPNGTVG
jgi:hypothetical protein